MVDPRGSRMAIEPILSAWRAFAEKGAVFCFLLEETEQIAPNVRVGGLVKIFDCKLEGRIVPTTVTRNGAGPPLGAKECYT
jgi:hypothetical protein